MMYGRMARPWIMRASPEAGGGGAGIDGGASRARLVAHGSPAAAAERIGFKPEKPTGCGEHPEKLGETRRATQRRRKWKCDSSMAYGPGPRSGWAEVGRILSP